MAAASTTQNGAWVYSRRGHPSDTLEWHTRPIPSAPAGGIVIKTRTVSINPVDYKMASAPGWMRRVIGGPPFGTPCVPCMDFAGVVYEAAPGSAWMVGDEVLGRLAKPEGNGSLQEYLPISSDVPLTRKPSDLSWEQAAALPLVYITVYGCLVQRTGLPFEPTSPRTSQLSALILGGTSATGSVAIQLAKKMGLRVTTTCSGSSKSIVEKIGADEVIDYRTQDVAQAAIQSPCAPFAVILDCVGGTELLPHLDTLLLQDPKEPILGRYISIVGDKQDQSNFTIPDVLSLVSKMTYRALRGVLDPYIPTYTPFRSWLAGKPYAFHLDQPGAQAVLDTLPEFVQSAGDMLIDQVFDSQHAKAAFARAETGRAKGKVIIRFDS